MLKKVNVRFIYIAPQLPRLSGAVVTDRAGVQPRPQPKHAVTDSGL